MLHVNSDEVDVIVNEAAKAACDAMDEHFPGCEKGGITSNFQGLLVEALKRMLTGDDPLRKSTYTSLPTLVLDDHHFGNPLIRGDAFLIQHDDGLDWSYGKPKKRLSYLNDMQTGFVKIDSESLDAFTNFEAAVQVAVKWLSKVGETQAEAKLQVVPVVLTEKGYQLASHAQVAA